MDYELMQNFFDALAERLRFFPYLPDVFDVLVVALILYGILLWLKERRSRVVALGCALVAALYICARLVGMYLTLSFFHAGFTVIIVSLVIVFQDDLRRAFERFAYAPAFVRNGQRASEATTIDLIVEAMSSLAHRRIGALVVFEGREPLDRHTRGGIPLNGLISLPLLDSIFHPASPGHDGAVVVSHDRIKAFAVHLPLSTRLAEVGQAGARHTAALGLAERCDALVIVVSEERGTLSVAEAGKLEQGLSPSDLKLRLSRYQQRQLDPPLVPKRRAWFQNLRLKLVALALASLLWLSVAYRVETIQRTFVVPIEYRNLPSNLALDDSHPTEAQVTLTGAERVFDLESRKMVVSVDLSHAKLGWQEVVLSHESIDAPTGLAIREIKPRMIPLQVHRLTEVTLPVRVQFRAELPYGLRLVRVQVEPSEVPLLVTPPALSRISEVVTNPLNLQEISKTKSMQLPVILPDGAKLLHDEQTTVNVTIHVAKENDPNPPTER
jgi:uncharacterized protein (TIGR00159 family)